jgi:hypothetical protein
MGEKVKVILEESLASAAGTRGLNLSSTKPLSIKFFSYSRYLGGRIDPPCHQVHSGGPIIEPYDYGWSDNEELFIDVQRLQLHERESVVTRVLD